MTKRKLQRLTGNTARRWAKHTGRCVRMPNAAAGFTWNHAVVRMAPRAAYILVTPEEAAQARALCVAWDCETPTAPKAEPNLCVNCAKGVKS